MRRGQEFASGNEWDKALREYTRAANEFPNHIGMRSSLADALFKMNRNDDAMQVYQGLLKYNPNNTEALQRIGEVFARTGRASEAVRTFYRLKESLVKNNQTAPAIEALQQIVKIDPSRTEAYREIIDLAKGRGDRRTAAFTALTYASFCKSAGAYQDALSAVDEALTLQPNLAEATALKQELSALGYADTNHNQPSASKPAITNLEDARQETINSLLADAETALNNGDVGKALRQYEMAIESGAKGAEIFYTIGGLQAQQGNCDEAVKYLKQAAEDPEYAASAYFAMGQMYDEISDYEAAVLAYEDALNRIDLQPIGQDEIDELILMYEPLGEDYQRLGQDEKAAQLYNKLRDFIQGKRLRTEKTSMLLIKARELNERLDEKQAQVLDVPTPRPTTSIRLGTGNLSEDELDQIADSAQGGDGGIALGEGGGGGLTLGNGSGSLTPPEAPAGPIMPSTPYLFPSKLLQMEPDAATYPYMRAAEDFMRRGLQLAAIDACQEVIHYYPYYLPAQIILAEVYVAQDRVEQARSKYQFVVDLYQMRNEPIKAIEAYKRLADLSPDNMALRTKLANLMLQFGLKEDAAEISLGIIQNYVRSGQLERAVEECRKLKNQAPQSAAIRLQYGELLNRQEKFAEALPEFRRALEVEPGNLRILCSLSITLFLNNEGEVKWSSFKSVLERSRENTDSLMQVTDQYRQATMLYDHPGLHFALGCLYLQAEQTTPALRSFEMAVQRASSAGPSQAEFELLGRWQMGQLHQSQRHSDETVSELSKVISLIEKADPQRFGDTSDTFGALPSQALVYRKLARAFSESGKIDYAVKALKTVKRLLPYDREVYSELADLNFQQGNLNEALGELGELANHYEQAGKTEDMIEVLKQMVQLAPSRIEVHEKLSQVYLQRGLIPDGLKELDELARLQHKIGRVKDAVRSLQKAAEINWMMGQQSKSYELYGRIVQMSPGDIEARQQLVNLHIMSGRVKDATDEQRAIAQICLQSNQTQEAIAALHQVIMLAPEDTRAYFQLATVLTGVGEYGQAYKLYNRVLRLEPENEKALRLRTQVEQKGIEAGQIKQTS